MKPKYKVVRNKETEFWDDEIVDKAGEIYGIYVCNINTVTYCCSYEKSYLLHPVGVITENRVNDDLYNEIQHNWALGLNDPIYMLERTIDEQDIMDLDVLDDDTIDDIIDMVRCNISFYVP